MPKLIVMFKNQVINEYPFLTESITIGRKPDNHIVIDNLAVSGYHARIDKAGKDYILTDLQSTNGTVVNDQKIVSHKLTHGDSIVIRKHVILFAASEEEMKEQEAKAGPDETVMMDTEKQRELLSRLSGREGPVRVRGKIGVVSFIDDSKLGEFELNKKLTKIGKADTSEIKLSGMFMGATAATISGRPTGYTITHTGGMAKLKVNGKVVKKSASLEEFDTIEIGSYRFQFYLKEAKKS